MQLRLPRRVFHFVIFLHLATVLIYVQYKNKYSFVPRINPETCTCNVNILAYTTCNNMQTTLTNKASLHNTTSLDSWIMTHTSTHSPYLKGEEFNTCHSKISPLNTSVNKNARALTQPGLY